MRINLSCRSFCPRGLGTVTADKWYDNQAYSKRQRHSAVQPVYFLHIDKCCFKRLIYYIMESESRLPARSVLLPTAEVSTGHPHPCGSSSISKTFLPALWSPTLRFNAVVDFPVPPFWFSIAITLQFTIFTSYISSSLKIRLCTVCKDEKYINLADNW